MKNLRVVTYDPITRTSKVMEIPHNDTSALGLSVVAVVDNTGCARDDPNCLVCRALHRRIKAHLGATQPSGYASTKQED